MLLVAAIGLVILFAFQTSMNSMFKGMQKRKVDSALQYTLGYLKSFVDCDLTLNDPDNKIACNEESTDHWVKILVRNGNEAKELAKTYKASQSGSGSEAEKNRYSRIDQGEEIAVGVRATCRKEFDVTVVDVELSPEAPKGGSIANPQGKKYGDEGWVSFGKGSLICPKMELPPIGGEVKIIK